METTATASANLVAAAGLKTWFPSGNRWLGRRTWLRAVDGVDIAIRRGEIVGIVGESGSGKTTLGRSLLRLVEPSEGTLHFDGVDLLALRRNEMRAMRRRIPRHVHTLDAETDNGHPLSHQEVSLTCHIT